METALDGWTAYRGEDDFYISTMGTNVCAFQEWQLEKAADGYMEELWKRCAATEEHSKVIKDLRELLQVTEHCTTA